MIINLFIFIILILIVLPRIQNPYLWLDESGQFWIAKGLNHFSEPNSKTGNIVSVLNSNKFYNLDPGGFSLILHFWIKINSGVIWLRLLPLIFTTTGCYFLYKLLTLLKMNNFLKIIALTVIVLGPVTGPKIFELRAYSMEFCGIAMLLFGYAATLISFRKKGELIFILGGSLSILSRYDGYIFAILILLLSFNLNCWNFKNFKENIKVMRFRVIILIGLCVTIFLDQARIQSISLNAPAYLPTLRANKHLLVEKISLVYFTALFFSFLLLRGKKIVSNMLIYELFRIVIAFNIFVIILSLFGKFPWSPISSQNIAIYVPSLVLFLCIISSLLQSIAKRVHTLFIIGILVLLIPTYIYHFGNLKKLYSNQDFVTYLTETKFKSDTRFYVNYGQVPYVRFLMEFGQAKFNATLHYPRNFFLENDHAENAQSRFTLVEDYDYVIGEYVPILNIEKFKSLTKDSLAWKNQNK